MERAGGKGRTIRAITLLTGALVLTISAVAQTATPVADARSQRVVLISIADRKLAVLKDGEVLATFAVAVGAAVSPSPTGEFQIVSRVSHPTYYHPGKVIPSGKDNPLGTRWIGLSQQGYGIHGTNAPRSIGHAASHGCIRMRNRDVEQLFTMLQVGDVVRIRDERDEEMAQVFGDDEEVAELEPDQASGQ